MYHQLVAYDMRADVKRAYCKAPFRHHVAVEPVVAWEVPLPPRAKATHSTHRTHRWSSAERVVDEIHSKERVDGQRLFWRGLIVQCGKQQLEAFVILIYQIHDSRPHFLTHECEPCRIRMHEGCRALRDRLQLLYEYTYVQLL